MKRYNEEEEIKKTNNKKIKQYIESNSDNIILFVGTLNEQKNEDHNHGDDKENNFIVYNGLLDHLEYLVYTYEILYNNSYHNSLKVMRILNNKIIATLDCQHDDHLANIRYYIKNEKEDYLLSCWRWCIIEIWDIQNNFNKKFNISIGTTRYDALLLLNKFEKDYIVISNYSEKKSSEIYDFSEKTPLVKEIHGTKENETYYMIYWPYNNKDYIIECCIGKVSISNLFEDEIYTKFTFIKQCEFKYGFLFNDNKLCLNDTGTNFIRILDLINKNQTMQIKVGEAESIEVLKWDNNFAIRAFDDGFEIIDLKNGKKYNLKINKENGKFGKYRIKIKKINNIGECLFCYKFCSDWDDKSNYLRNKIDIYLLNRISVFQ